MVRLVNVRSHADLRLVEKAFPGFMPRGLNVDLRPSTIWIPTSRDGAPEPIPEPWAAQLIDPHDEKKRYIAGRTPVDFVNDLKIAWTSQTLLVRELVIAAALGAYVLGPKSYEGKIIITSDTPIFVGLEEAPSLDRFALALVHALHVAGNMRYCANRDCGAPYYLAPRGKYCSKKCAAPSQRAFKLAWWNKHKEEQLKKRRPKTKTRNTRKAGGK